MRGQRHAPAALYPRKIQVIIVQKAGWAPEPVWRGAENLTPTGIQSLDHPARSQLLYWLHYPAHDSLCWETKTNSHPTSQGAFMEPRKFITFVTQAWDLMWATVSDSVTIRSHCYPQYAPTIVLQFFVNGKYTENKYWNICFISHAIYVLFLKLFCGLYFQIWWLEMSLTHLVKQVRCGL